MDGIAWWAALHGVAPSRTRLKRLSSSSSSSLVIAFLPRRKSFNLMILEPKKVKFLTVSIVSPSTCHEVMGPDAMIFIF